MNSPVFLPTTIRVIKAVRLSRLIALLLIAITAGLVSDWLRTETRLVFPRPLPEFTTRIPSITLLVLPVEGDAPSSPVRFGGHGGPPSGAIRLGTVRGNLHNRVLLVDE